MFLFSASFLAISLVILGAAIIIIIAKITITARSSTKVKPLLSFMVTPSFYKSNPGSGLRLKSALSPLI